MNPTGARFDTAQEFCEGAFVWWPMKWFTTTGICRMQDIPGCPYVSDTRVLRIELVTRNNGGCYEGFSFTLTNKNTGVVVTQKTFWFKDFLPSRGPNGGSCVIDHCGWDWYEPRGVPDITTPLTNAIWKFIKVWM